MSLIDFEDFYEGVPAKKKKVTLQAKVTGKPKPVAKKPAAKPVASKPSPVVFRPVSGSARAQAGRRTTLEPDVQVKAKALITSIKAGVKGKTGFSLSAKPKAKAKTGKSRGLGGIASTIQKTRTAIEAAAKPAPKKKPAGKKKKTSLFSLHEQAKQATKRLTKSVGEKLKDLPVKKREQVAARVVLGPLQRLASKARTTPIHSVATARKAIEAVKPIAEACNCKSAPVIKKVDAQLVADGFPSGTAKTLLSQLHDMNTSLEKAAVERLATHEHDVLTAKHDFEHTVLARLAQIAQCLPKCHPARTATFLSIFKKAK